MTLPAKKILRIIDAAGLLRVQLAADLWLVLVPVKATTLEILNPESFTPYEKKTDIIAAKPILLGFGTGNRSQDSGSDLHWITSIPDRNKWLSVGAWGHRVTTMDGLSRCLREVANFDLQEALDA